MNSMLVTLFLNKSELICLHTVKWFQGLVLFYDISTLVGYFMPNPVYTFILNIYDL